MKTVTIALFSVSFTLVGGCLWASLALPMRVELESSSGTGTLTITTTMTLWRKPLSQIRHLVYASSDEKPHGEGVGPIPDERIMFGEVSPDGARQAQWSKHERNGSRWSEATVWFLDDREVTREEWVRQK